jgi:hypothetical protein
LLLIENLLMRSVPDSLGYAGFVTGQAAGVVFIALWLPCAWLGLRLAGFRERQVLLLVALTGLTGFCIYNSLYIWPKLLGAGFGLMMILSLAVLVTRPASGTLLLSIAALSSALALLCHGGVVFGVAAALLVCAPAILRQGLRPVLISAALAAIPLMSWIAWQAIYKPGGNSLVRFMLTGDFGQDRRDVSVLADVIAAYSRLTTHAFLEMKTNALLTLFGLRSTDCTFPRTLSFAEAGIGALRFNEFYHLAYILAIPALAAICCTTFRSPGEPKRLGTMVTLLWTSLVATLLWIIIAWKCHIVHAFSYQAILAALIGCWGIALATNLRLATLFAGCSVALTFLTWIVDPLYQAITVRWPWMIVLALLLAVSGRYVIGAVLGVHHCERNALSDRTVAS